MSITQTPPTASIERYLEAAGYNLQAAGTDKLVTCCPLHGEHTPSFYVFLSDGHAHCFGCPEGHNHWNNLPALLRDLEFGHLSDDRAAWRAAYERARGAGWIQGAAVPHVPSLDRTPTLDQRRAMAVVEQLTHGYLTDSRVGVAARRYLSHVRRLEGPHVGLALARVGYMPSTPRFEHEIRSMLTQLFGPQYPLEDLLVAIGLTSSKKVWRLKSRLLFFCHDPFASGKGSPHYPLFYQARTILGSTPRRFTFLNPPLAKAPLVPAISLPAALPGTFIVEGAMDAEALAANGFLAVGVLGCSLDSLPLEQFPLPLYCGLDNEPTGAGGVARAHLKALCAAARLPLFDLVYPPGIKDCAAWLERVGSNAFRQQIARGLRPVSFPVDP